MRSFGYRLLILSLATASVGCSSGISRREGSGHTQSLYLSELLDGSDIKSAGSERAPLRAPATLAVAQIGEVAPPQTMMTRLREKGTLFSRVEAIPALDSRSYYDHRNRGRDDSIDTLRAMAGSLGLEYLLLVGGTVDELHSATPLSVLNLTIVGAFVVPSHRTVATMKASGALIEVRTGRLVSISVVEAKAEQLRPLASAEGDMDRKLDAMRDQLTVSLADAVAVDSQNVATSSGRFIPPPAESIAADEPASPIKQRRFQGK